MIELIFLSFISILFCKYSKINVILTCFPTKLSVARSEKKLYIGVLCVRFYVLIKQSQPEEAMVKRIHNSKVVFACLK